MSDSPKGKKNSTSAGKINRSRISLPKYASEIEKSNGRKNPALDIMKRSGRSRKGK